MNVQITRVSLFQTAKVIGALYFVGAIIGAVFFFVASLLSHAPKPPYAIVFIVLAPFLYALLGFVFTFIGAWVYNQVARVVGGIEYTTTEVRDF